MIAIRGSALLSARTRQLPHGAVAAATKAVSPPFPPPPPFSPLLLPSLHLLSPNSPNAMLLLPLIAKTDPARGLQPRELPCRIYYEVAALFEKHAIFEREKLCYKYFKYYISQINAFASDMFMSMSFKN